MNLDENQHAKIESWLIQHQFACCNCKNRHDLAFWELISWPCVVPVGPQSGQPITFVVPVVCGACAYVHFFGAKIMGLP